MSVAREARKLTFRDDGDPAILVEEILAVCATNADATSKAWVTDQYDRYVRSSTAPAGPDDADIVHVAEETGRGMALNIDANRWYTKLDPYAGARQTLTETYRNVCAVGTALAVVTDCLNFGNPECLGTMWQLVTAMTGLADGCQRLSVPVTGGNVSLYNSSDNVMGTEDYSTSPTPMVRMLGPMDDIRRTVPNGFTAPEWRIVLLGTTRPGLDGSAWARGRGCFGGHPPVVDFDAEEVLGRVLVFGTEQGLYLATHDLSTAGLAGALVNMVYRGGCGAEANLAKWGGELSSTEKLFSESQARALVAVVLDRLREVLARTEAVGIAALETGMTSGDSLRLIVSGGVVELSVAQLQAVRETVLPGCFD